MNQSITIFLLCVCYTVISIKGSASASDLDTTITTVDPAKFDVWMEEDYHTGNLMEVIYPLMPLENGTWKFQNDAGLIYCEFHVESDSMKSKILRHVDENRLYEKYYTGNNTENQSLEMIIAYYPGGQSHWKYWDFSSEKLKVKCENDTLLSNRLGIRTSMACECKCNPEWKETKFYFFNEMVWFENGEVRSESSKHDDLISDIQKEYGRLNLIPK